MNSIFYRLLVILILINITNLALANSSFISIEGVTYEVPILERGGQLGDFWVKQDGEFVTLKLETNTYVDLKQASNSLYAINNHDYTPLKEQLSAIDAKAREAVIAYNTEYPRAVAIEQTASLFTSLATSVIPKNPLPNTTLDSLKAAELSAEQIKFSLGWNMAEYEYASGIGNSVISMINNINTASSTTNPLTIDEIKKFDAVYFSAQTSGTAAIGIFEAISDKKAPGDVRQIITGILTSLTMTSTASAALSIVSTAIREPATTGSYLTIEGIQEGLLNGVSSYVSSIDRARIATNYELSKAIVNATIAEGEKLKAETRVYVIDDSLPEIQNLESEKTNEVSTLIQQIEAEKLQNDDFRDELRQAEDDLAASEAIYLELKAEIDAIAEELEDLQGDIALYERALSNDDKGIIDLTPVQRVQYENTLAQLIQTEQELQESLRGKDGPLKNEERAKTQYEQLLSEAQQNLLSSDTKISNLETNKQITEQEVVELGVQKTELTEEKTQLTSLISDKTEEISELETLKAELEKQVSETELVEIPSPIELASVIPTQEDNEKYAQLKTASPAEMLTTVDVPLDTRGC